MDTLDERLQELPGQAAVARSIEAGFRKRNGFELHDAVQLPGISCLFEVVDLCDPSLVGLRAPSGRIVRAGWRVCKKAKTRGNDNGNGN